MTAFKRVKPEFIMDINAKIQHDSNRGASAFVLRQGEMTMFDLEQACEEFELNAAEMKERINGLKKLPGDQQVFIGYVLNCIVPQAYLFIQEKSTAMLPKIYKKNNGPHFSFTYSRTRSKQN